VTYNYTVSIKLPREILELLDKLVADGIYSSRSEAIRDGIRLVLRRWRDELYRKEKKREPESWEEQPV